MGELVPFGAAQDAKVRSKNLGILDYEALVARCAETPAYLVEDLITHESIAILVGDPGLGKTPLAISLAVAIASETPFLGRKTQAGSVLYCPGEGTPTQLCEMIKSLSDTANLPKPPNGLAIWSPFWDADTDDPAAIDSIIKRVRETRPLYVVVDNRTPTSR